MMFIKGQDRTQTFLLPVSHDNPIGLGNEVHKEGCSKILSNKTELGYRSNCHSAVAKAKEYYRTADGCYYCCNECHTS